MNKFEKSKSEFKIQITMEKKETKSSTDGFGTNIIIKCTCFILIPKRIGLESIYKETVSDAMVVNWWLASLNSHVGVSYWFQNSLVWNQSIKKPCRTHWTNVFRNLSMTNIHFSKIHEQDTTTNLRNYDTFQQHPFKQQLRRNVAKMIVWNASPNSKITPIVHRNY